MDNIREIFNQNIELLGYVDRAVILFREGRYDEALGMVAESGEGVSNLCETVLDNIDYFSGVDRSDICAMMSALIDAKKNKDYVLLADFFELQLSPFICSIQERIVDKEDFLAYDTSTYNKNIELLEQKLTDGMKTVSDEHPDTDEDVRMRVNRNAELEAPLSPEYLLQNGYSVEFTSCGLMTLRAPLEDGESVYMHTNTNILRESFMLADRWREKGISTYIVYGFGLGYHIAELLELDKFARVTVYESDINVLKLFCAFADARILTERRLTVIYDPDRTLIEQRLIRIRPDEKACVHYPSMRRRDSGKLLKSVAPFADIVERC